jgi:hypothetical protein
MKKIIIIVFALTLLSISFYKAVQETDEVMQYAPHIMDIPPEIDLSDTMVFYIKDTTEEVTNLDKVDSIVWWEIQNDSVIIWTEEDEKRADIDRFNYIRSLDTTFKTKEK